MSGNKLCNPSTS